MKLWFVLCVILTPADFKSVVHEANVGSPEEGKTLFIPAGKCSEFAAGSNISEDDTCAVRCSDINRDFEGGECRNELCHCKLDLSGLITKLTKADNRQIKTRKGVKCKNLIRLGRQNGSQNHRGCGVHCRLAHPQNRDGRCVQGICQCTREVIAETTTTKPEEEDDEQEEENTCEEGTCASRCSKANNGNSEGYCTENVCRCRTVLRELSTQRTDIKGRETVPCEHRKKTVSDEICRSHCQDFSKDHPEGRCVDGVCQCGYAVFEIMESETEQAEDKGNDRIRRVNPTRRPQRKRP